jgi:hypothetical protein
MVGKIFVGKYLAPKFLDSWIVTKFSSGYTEIVSTFSIENMLYYIKIDMLALALATYSAYSHLL